MDEKKTGPVPGRTERVLLAAGVLALAVIPILLVHFPPATDLPQHLAQIRLFKEALADPGGPYTVQWLAPNHLVYLLLLAFWTVLPVGLIARASLVLIIVLWVTAIHALGAARGRSAAAAIVASLLIFNQSCSWGFLSFMIGFPVFVLWFALTTKYGRDFSWGQWWALAGMSALLYGSHALWFAAGAAWLIVIGIARRTAAAKIGLRLTALLPGGLAALLWYPGMSASRTATGVDVAPHWASLFDRLASIVPSALGWIPGPAGIVAFFFVVFWAGLSIWQNRRRLRDAVDRELLMAATFFLAIVVIAPDSYMNTICFSSRWVPASMIFLLLALPAPSFRRLPSKAVALSVAMALSSATAIAWVKYEAHDLSGLPESLEAIAPSSRVLGLDLVKESDFIDDRPFLQLFAYAQVFKGGELNFSFAEHYSGLVAYRGRRKVPWTPRLEWNGDKVRRPDFGFFDFVLVNGEDRDHERLASFAGLLPVTRSGRWRLYRVSRPALAGIVLGE
jgi:hypothetical protein